MNEENAIDVTTLTPAQLKALRKQLADHKAETIGTRSERNRIIHEMCSEKGEDGEFVNTTRDIARALADNGVCEYLTSENFETPEMQDEVQREIRKIQARKQLLEKKTNEKGENVYPEGTFGYKGVSRASSTLSANRIKPDTVVAFFKAGRVTELTEENVTYILAQLQG